jgi:hypothetical protein
VSEPGAGRCAGTPRFPDCAAVEGEAHPDTGVVVVLAYRYVEGQSRQLCQRCLRSWEVESATRFLAVRRKSLRNMEPLPFSDWGGYETEE